MRTPSVDRNLGCGVVPLPPRLWGQWVLLLITLPGSYRTPTAPHLTFAGRVRINPAAQIFPSRVLWSNHFYALCVVPQQADHIVAQTLGVKDLAAGWPLVRVQRLNRVLAAVLLILGHLRQFIYVIRGGSAGSISQLRLLLSVWAERANRSPSYNTWVQLFDTWTDDDIAKLRTSSYRTAWPNVSALVFCKRSESSAAAQATLASVKRQIIPVDTQVVLAGEARPLVDPQTYALLLQAGEVLPRHAIALLLDQAARKDRPAILFGDEDRLARNGRRHSPLFKPQAGYALILSGTLTRGAWLIRGDLLNDTWRDFGWAETTRLGAWLLADVRAIEPISIRVPFVLTHRRDDTEEAPPKDLAAVIAGHLSRTRRVARIDARHYPLRVTPRLSLGTSPRVTLIIPSTCRAPHVMRCLRAIVRRTQYPALDVVIVVTQDHPLDEEQSRLLQPVTANQRVRVIIRPGAAFNYAAVNNFAARMTESEFLCLLNDDVKPITEDWLEAMLGHFSDPRVGVVGAKLYYSSALVQHGGILMGVGGLAEHMNRFLPRHEPGYASRAILNQDVACVTGACLLVQRQVFNAVGGLDETYPVAYNDVDFCLRVRQSGRSVVFSADAQLYHYESLSFGHHFSGERAGSEAEELKRMRERWNEIVHEDPYHNPNLSLECGCEWQMAFPPRVVKPAMYWPS